MDEATPPLPATAAKRLPQEIIRTKRDGGTLADADIAQFVSGITDGSISEMTLLSLRPEVVELGGGVS